MAATYELTYRNPDGTRVPSTEASEGVRRTEPVASSLMVDRYVDDLTALQIGLARVVLGLRPVSIDRTALVRQGRVEARELSIQRVFFDYPDTEDDLVPVASATVMASGEQTIETKGPLSGNQPIEGTEDVYAPGTHLRELYELKASLEVVFVLGEKDDRSAVRKAMAQAFVEPGDEREGRRVVIPEYFDRVGRYYLRGFRYDDDPDIARGKRWPLVARIDADIQAVDLVAKPVELRPRFSVGP